jgi:DUF2075 family protein
MIVYQSTKTKFLDDVMSNDIENIILSVFKRKLLRSTSESEIGSWRESLQHMNNILFDRDIPDDCGIAIEFQIPLSSKRMDFTISGKNEKGEEHVILIELKRWSSAEKTEKDAIVKTRFKGGLTETSHPCYQAWSYSALLQGFNQTIYDEDITLKPCAYLHNYVSDGVINDSFYQEYIDKAPLFLKSDAFSLREFIKAYVKYGNDKNIIYRIDAGKIKPSKILADNVTSMLKGNKEFIMIDDQKIVYENALALAKKATAEKKHVYIIEGGPGTGKSVVAINLLVETLKAGLNSRYISKNAAPRNVYESKLTGHFRKSEISNLFSGSGAFINTEKSFFDTLIIDEAHRLNKKSGLFKNLGTNQIKELISASKCAIFFIDEDQKVTLDDIGDKEEIIKWAKWEGAVIHQGKLESQFRCNGSEGYIAWLDNILEIRPTANTSIVETGFDFRVLKSPSELREIITERNKRDNRARMVAGYCWDWVSREDPRQLDVNIPEFKFSMRWNLSKDKTWIASDNSIHDIGCIHTCQGLEVDHIGVIVGTDLIVRDGKIITNPSQRSRMDQSTKAYKSLYKKEPVIGPQRVDKIIKNTYRTLMTRGMKSCYVYFVDKETEEYFNNTTIYSSSQ